MDGKDRKKISVSVDQKIVNPKPYSDFLVRSTEDALYIDLAEREDTGDEIKIHVKESISVSADAMITFAARILNELVDYENRYQNGKGIKLSE